MNKILKFPLHAANTVRKRIIADRLDKKALTELIKHKNARSTDGKAKVVFIVQYIPAWNKLQPVYEEIKRRDDMEAFILCVPISIKNHEFFGTIRENDTYKYFKEHGYKCINAHVNGQWFDLECFCPDYVFHSRPYDTFMPVIYTSGVIAKYAVVCNILYGASMSVRMRNTIYNRDYYRNCCYYFALDKTEADFWNDRYKRGVRAGVQKAFSVGSTAFESILDAKCDKKSSRTLIMWTPRWTTDKTVGGSNFFNYKDAFLEAAEKDGDTDYLFRPHPLMFGNFVNTGQMTAAEAEDYKRRCAELPNTELDSKKEYAETFWQTDMLVTDISGIMIEYFITGKPMIYCTSDVEHEFTDCYKPMIAACYIVHNKKELHETIAMLKSGSDPMAEKRREVIKYYLGDGSKASVRTADIIANDYKQQEREN